MECRFCKKNLINKCVLKHHQKTAKYCLKIQGKDIEGKFKCKECKKSFTRKDFLKYHENICIEHKNKKSREKDEIISRLSRDNKDLLEAYQRLAELYVIDGKGKIDKLNKKYLKRVGRTKYDGENVIYIVSTRALQKERRYIMGKAVNLTNRLSTYNKTDEHKVIFYSSCPSKQKMSLVENMVFDKLEKYREQANRERFILPQDKDINLFSDTIKKCIEFVK